MAIHAVILAGGGGRRLWPLSRTLYPKQFLALLGEHSLLQRTVLRIHDMIPAERLWIVTAQEQSFYVQSQLGDIGHSGRIIAEPQGRNTAAAVGLAACHIQQRDPEAVTVVLPADHWIKKPQEFLSLIQDAIALAERGALVTLGIIPGQAETGYGYICRGEPLANTPSEQSVYAVSRFVEKPDISDARRYVDSGEYYWNAGIFVWRTSVIMDEIAAHLPALSQGLEEIAPALHRADEKDTLDRVYAQLASVSIDHGVLEKSSRLVVIPAAIGWSDLGKWSTIHQFSDQDERGNVLSPSVLDIESENSLVYSIGRTIATIGLKNMIVVDTPDALLVCTQERTSEVASLVQQLLARGDQTVHTPNTVRRPWGSYTVLEEGPQFKVKRIVVEPGGGLSLQRHRRRSEHWVVISGVATIIRGEEELTLGVDQSTYIPQGTKHRLSNRGTQPLQIIEVQTGAYLGEDDVERLEDVYGRV